MVAQFIPLYFALTSVAIAAGAGAIFMSYQLYAQTARVRAARRPAEPPVQD